MYRGRRKASWLAAPAAYLLAAVAALAACSAPPDLSTQPADRSVGPGDGFAPGRSVGASPAGGSPGPAAASGSQATPGTTEGVAAAASQPIGQGYVDTLTENRMAGTPGWRASLSTPHRRIEGYADAVSAVAGQPVRLFVSSTARQFHVQLLRVGWYRGVGAREVWRSVDVPGGRQAPAQVAPATRMITAPWKVSAVLPTQGLVAGDYLAKLVGEDGASSFVPLAIREPASTGAVLMVNSTLTWLAYNPWGGANSYTASEFESKGEGYDERSVVSSYDRPYARGSGTGGFFDEEMALVQTAERLGLRLNYAADLDLHAHPEVLRGARGVALLGHSEYWSRQMRTVLTDARDRGTNLAFLGANDVFRRIRLQPAATGPYRLMVNYKDGAADPVKTEETTADWPHDPYRDPQAELTGVQYRCARARADMVVTDPDAWLFRGLGLRAGQRLPGLVGSEFDRVTLAVPTPRPIQIMAHSPVSCYGYPEFSDLTWYTTPSGAGVFSAGTLDWNVGITSPDAVTRTVVTTVTERVLKAIGEPVAGRQVPAVDNALRYYSPSGVPLDASGRPLARRTTRR